MEVTGLPNGATEDLVINYFENVRRSKGGHVFSVEMKPEFQKCLVTFESAEGKSVVFHVFSSYRFIVLPRSLTGR